MKTLNTWAPPVAVSLLLHVALIALVTYQLSSSSTVKNQVQAITVELSAQPSTSVNKPLPQKTKPVPEPVKTEQAIVEKPVLEEVKTPAATTEQISSAAVPAKESGLNVQPLSKLTRPPAFLRKIEPVYPSAEQRAGSQAYVLAEVTIDAQGNVLDVKIMKSAGSAFDNAVVEALKKSIFVPGYIGKDAVAVRVLVPFRFNLR